MINYMFRSEYGYGIALWSKVKKKLKDIADNIRLDKLGSG